ncbi:MAG: hypothetical protein V5A38_06455 [Halolamina sp.]
MRPNHEHDAVPVDDQRAVRFDESGSKLPTAVWSSCPNHVCETI